MICTTPDNFLDEKTIWVATLSNGTRVFLDDDRENSNPSSAWLRLREFVERRDLSIQNLKIKFRDHVVELPAAEQYHFSKAVGCMVGCQEEFFYIIGVINNGRFERQWYKIPEIIVTRQSDVRSEDWHKYKDQMIKGCKNG